MRGAILVISPGVSQFISDYADQAMVLPAVAMVGLWLLLAESRRAVLIWVASCAVVLGGIFLLKLVLPCMTSAYGLRSPSGHTASTILVSGAVLLLVARPERGRRSWAVVAALAIGILVAVTRLELGAHTLPEVIAGAIMGTAGVLVFATADLTPPRVPSLYLVAGCGMLALLLHGTRLPAERWIDQLSCRATWAALAPVDAQLPSPNHQSARDVYRPIGTQSSPTL